MTWVDDDGLEVEFTCLARAPACQIVIGEIIEQLSRTRRNLHRALVVRVSFAKALLGIEDGALQNERLQIRGMLFQYGAELLFGFRHLPLLKNSSCFVECELCFRLLSNQWDARQCQ